MQVVPFREPQADWEGEQLGAGEGVAPGVVEGV